jgi:hypothetical protein
MSKNIPFFCLPNLSESRLCRRDPAAYPHPGYTTRDKRRFRAWCADNSTDHLFFNLTEGLNPHLRVSKQNPPQFLHGIVADYDANLGDTALADAISRANGKVQPAFGSRTFSGGARLVWLFAVPMPIHGSGILKRALNKARSALGINALLPGLDENAFFDVCQYYECGTGWHCLGGASVGADQTWHWIEAGSRQKDFRKSGAVIPLTEVEKELQARFPGRWGAPFTEGTRGVRFWDPDADALSVIVRDNGCQCFTGDKPFMSWADIFGRDFVERHEQRKIGGAIEDIYFDGRHYWRRLPDMSWQAMNSTIVARHLRVEFGLDPDPYGQPASELDRVIHEIEQRKAVAGAMPFVHHRDTLIRINRKIYLNTSTTSCLEPVGESQEWGSQFPFIADYLERLLDPEPLAIFLSWLHRFYASAHNGRLLKGQAVFLAGPVAVGKTLLSERLVAPLVGGKQEATDFLLGGSNFNKELFEYALWTIDDDPVSGDPKAHLRFSNLVKKVAANHTFNYHAKFRDQLTVPWNGRILVTCNDDPESIRILPDLDVSIKDKLILLKAAAKAQRDFPPNVADIIAGELPYFARWLLDFEIPCECLGNARFGVRSYIDADLEETARQSSVTNSFAEILDLWRDNYFRQRNDPGQWRGTATQLLSEMQMDETIEKLLRDVSPRVVGRRLASMVVQGYPTVRFKREPGSGRREYTVLSDSNLQPEETDADPF